MGQQARIALADADATRRLGAALGRAMQGGDAIALVGDLGAGKTTLVQGLVEALGAGVAASSPTFSLVNEYTGGRLVVWHADLYRIERAAELAELGLDDVAGDARGVMLVEWADNFAVMPADHLRIELAHAGEAREAVVTAAGPRSDALVSAAVAAAA